MKRIMPHIFDENAQRGDGILSVIPFINYLSFPTRP